MVSWLRFANCVSLITKKLHFLIPAVHPADFIRRVETERFKKFTYAEIVARDKANLTSSGSRTTAKKTVKTVQLQPC
jgi:hypothetical protein